VPLYSDESLDERSIPDETSLEHYKQLELLEWPKPNRSIAFSFYA